MLWAACCLGFFGLLWAEEFTCPSWNMYISSMLSPGDVMVDSRDNPTYIILILRHSKTDVFGSGSKLYIGATGTNLCPVAAILAYLANQPNTPGPIFLFERGIPLLLPALVEAVRQALGLSVWTYPGSVVTVSGSEQPLRLHWSSRLSRHSVDGNCRHTLGHRSTG